MTGIMTLPTMFGAAIGLDAATAALILSFALLLTIVLILATLGMDAMPSAIVLVGGAGALTAMGWFPLGLFIIIIVVMVLFLIFGGALGGGRD